jgi:hypothetical protein
MGDMILFEFCHCVDPDPSMFSMQVGVAIGLALQEKHGFQRIECEEGGDRLLSDNLDYHNLHFLQDYRPNPD